MTAIFSQILRQAHTLIGGRTGGGKSVAVNGIIYCILQMMPAAAQFVLIDPKRVELRPYRRAPHCIGYADTPETMADAIRRTAAEMDARYSYMAAREWMRKYDGAALYLIIDELSDLLDVSPECKRDLKRILQLGRAAGVHVIAATQHVDRKTLPAEIQRNFTAVLALPQKSAIESRQMIGKTGAEKLRTGTAYYIDPDNLDGLRVDIPMIPADTLRAALESCTQSAQITPTPHTAPTQRPTGCQPRTVSAPPTMPTQRTQPRRIPGEILYIIAAIAIIGIAALQKIS